MSDLEIKVMNSMSSTSKTVRIRRNGTVRDLMTSIAEASGFGVPIERQRLISGGRMLRPDEALSPGGVVHLVPRQAQQPRRSPQEGGSRDDGRRLRPGARFEDVEADMREPDEADVNMIAGSSVAAGVFSARVGTRLLDARRGFT